MKRIVWVIIALLIDLYILILVGSEIGALTVVLLVILSALLGMFFFRQQGFRTMTRIQQELSQGEVPSFEFLEAMVLVISGGLLLIPGFITDIIGLLGLIPPTRAFLINYAANTYAKRFEAREQAPETPIITRVKHYDIDNDEHSADDTWEDHR